MAINLGEINFGLGADIRRLEAARKAVLNFGRDVNRAANSQAEGARAVESALRRQERAMISAMNTTLRMNDAVRRSGGSDKHINELTSAYNRLVKEMTRGPQSALAFQRSQEDFATSTNRVNRAIRDEQAATAALDKALKNAEATAVQSFNAQERAQRKAAEQAAQAAKAQENASLREERAFYQAERAVMSYQRALAKLPRAPQMTGNMNSAGQLDAFKAAYSAAGNPLAQQKAVQNFQKAMYGLNAELDKFRGKQKVFSPLEDSLRRLADVSVLVSGPMSGLATRLSLIASVADSVSIKTAALVVGISAGAVAFGLMGNAAVKTSKEIQRITQSLDSINGNMTITKVEMADLMQIADRAGANFSSTAQAFARLQAASAGTNMEGEATRKIFQQMLFVSQKLGLSVADTEGIFRALEQIMSKGTVQAEELRGQLGDRLPGAFNIMAAAMGVTTKKLGEMMKKGEVSSGALVKFADEAAKRLGVDITQPIDQTIAAENRLANAITRMNDAMDKAIGFSTAYQMALNGLTSVVDFLANNMTQVIGTIGAVAGATVGLLTAIYAPAIISGFSVLLTTIRALAVATVAWNAALLANPLGAIATLLIRLAAATAGAVLGYELLATAVGDTASAHVGAIPEVKAYIRAQEDMKYSIRDTTSEYIKQQEVFLQGLKNQAATLHKQIQDAEHTLFDETGGWMRDPLSGMPIRDTVGIEQARQSLPQYEAQLKSVSITVQDASTDIQKLNDILAKQTAVEKNRGGALEDFAAGTAKNSSTIRNAIDEAMDAIREAQAGVAIQGLPKYQQEWARVQADINKSIDDFKDKLVEAKVPLQTVNALTAKYGELTRQLKEGEYYIKTHISAWEALSGVLGRGLDTAMSNMVDGILEGQTALEIFRDSAKLVVADLLKTFLQLAAINPLKNALFGGDPSTGMPFMTLGGGLLGSLFNGFKTPAPFVPNGTLSSFLGANAGGTTGWRGGMTWVGEEGPEIVDVPAGARILPQSAWANKGGMGGGGSDFLQLRVGVDNDSLGVYVEKASRKVAMEEAASGFKKGITHYGNTKFHDDFEKHAKKRRNRGGKGS